MSKDQRILDIIAASSEKKPANIGPIVNELVGERIADLIDQRREETRSSFFAEPEVDSDPEYSDED